MKKILTGRTGYSLLLAFLLGVNGLAASGLRNDPAEKIVLENGKIKLEFHAENGAFLALTDLEDGEIVATSAAPGEDSPWEAHWNGRTSGDITGIADAGSFHVERPDRLSLELTWTDFKGEDDRALKVVALISLEQDQALSTWDIRLEGIEGQHLFKVIFPNISGLRNGPDSKLAVPEWMGSLIRDPDAYLASRGPGDHQMEWMYPGGLSMQFLALYGTGEKGFQVRSEDPYAYPKKFVIARSASGSLSYRLENFPETNGEPLSYSPVYPVKISTFQGDWITAAQNYREWGVQQSWSLNSRLKNGLTADWLEETALWVWNRGWAKDVLDPAVALKERLGLPVSVLWHWWHGCAYDDGFPEYFPPRDGSDTFEASVKRARERGVRPLVYMNELQWGASTKSWETENAERYAVKDEQGNLRSHVYNIFSGKALTNMCVTTPFWRNTYSGLAHKAINKYNVGGIYMDQACISVTCYDKSHGHSIGGGNYWAAYSGMLTNQIRSGVDVDKEITLSGEGACEAWLPYLDAFLALQVSRERYSDAAHVETIPLFQAVYHEYGITYGNYSSLLKPPYDDLWPEEHRPEDELQLLDNSFNKQFLMEQARSFVWGMQPMIANYRSFLDSDRNEEMDYLTDLAKVRSSHLKYLLYGTFCRAPEMEIPREPVILSRLSIYAGQKEKVTTSQKTFPTIYHAAWKSPEGQLGIAVASISNESYPLSMEFGAEDYGLAGSGKLFVTSREGKKQLGVYSGGRIQIQFELPPQDICMIEVIPDVEL